MIKLTSQTNMVSLRIYENEDDLKSWQKTKATAYMPTYFADHKLNKANISKRLTQTYFKSSPQIIAIRWNYYGKEDKSVLVLRTDLKK